MHSKKSPLPYPFYFWLVTGFTLSGLFNSLYLSYTHYKNYTDIAYSSFCAISQSINCDTVAQSPWSIFLNVPVSTWGVTGYLFLLGILTNVRIKNDERTPLWALLFTLTLIYSCVSLFLAYVSVVKIESVCILCLVSYTVNFLLLFTCWIIRRRFDGDGYLTSLMKGISFFLGNLPIKLWIAFVIITMGAMVISYPHYWEYVAPVARSAEVSSGITRTGNPWIGAEKPVLTIEEFSDYQCFQCSKMHSHLRSLVNKYPNAIRLVHYHYPMDHEFNTVLVKEPFHIGSGRLALFAIAASEQNRFWDANDAIFSLVRQNKEEIDIVKLATKLKLDPKELQKDIYSPSTLKKLEEDIRKGLKSKITGTPSFLVNGKMYTGYIPFDIIEPFLHE